MAWAVKLDKPQDFIGRWALERARRSAPASGVLVGFTIPGGELPSEGAVVLARGRGRRPGDQRAPLAAAGPDDRHRLGAARRWPARARRSPSPTPAGEIAATVTTTAVLRPRRRGAARMSLAFLTPSARRALREPAGRCAGRSPVRRSRCATAGACRSPSPAGDGADAVAWTDASHLPKTELQGDRSYELGTATERRGLVVPDHAGARARRGRRPRRVPAALAALDVTAQFARAAPRRAAGARDAGALLRAGPAPARRAARRVATRLGRAHAGARARRGARPVPAARRRRAGRLPVGGRLRCRRPSRRPPGRASTR